VDSPLRRPPITQCTGHFRGGSRELETGKAEEEVEEEKEEKTN
jgi:hypothetical protein